jgi:Ras family protein A
LKEDPKYIEELNSYKKNQKPVETSEAQKIAKKVGAAKYLECSAKTGVGVVDEAIRIVTNRKKSTKTVIL